MAELACRYFSGYKPCGKNDICKRSQCRHFESVTTRILIIHLEALGAVLRSTSLIKAIKRQYPDSHLTWVTKSPAHHLLLGISQIDQVLTLNQEDLLILSALEFDLALVIDKSKVATGVLKATTVKEVKGFIANPQGAIVPANPEAQELWEIGLSDHKKFFVNKKTEQHLTHEALDLGLYARDEYVISLSPEEQALSKQKKQLWSKDRVPIIGLNTGCSPALKAKKLSVEGHRKLIELIKADDRLGSLPLVLLGGPEDTERNLAIAQDLPVILSPTAQGLRDGLTSVQACDLIFSGDSLGMHMAIALKKWVVAWFGPSCAQEIDLYERGEKILTQASCSPCWKRVCSQSLMCYDQVDFQQVLNALTRGLKWHTSYSKPPSPEIYFSPSL